MIAKEAGPGAARRSPLRQDPPPSARGRSPRRSVNKDTRIETAERRPAGRPRHHRRTHQRRRRCPRHLARALLGQRRRHLKTPRHHRRRAGDDAGKKKSPRLPPETLKFQRLLRLVRAARDDPSHRVLAIRRGAAEESSCSASPRRRTTRSPIARSHLPVKGNCPRRRTGATGRRGRYKRLLSLSMETETRLEAKKQADAAAIDVFRQQPAPAPARLAARPEGRPRHRPRLPHRLQDRRASTRQGKLLHNDVIYPDQGAAANARSRADVKRLVAEVQDRGHRHRQRHRRPRNRNLRPRPRAARGDRRRDGQRDAARRSTRPPKSPARSSRTRTSPSAARSPSAAA